MSFIGRTQELSKLKRLMSSDDMSMALIYGRRRVGKSELVKQALKESEIPAIYYECKQVAEESNVKGICEMISEVMDLPKLGFTTIEDVTKYLFEQANDKKMIFVIHHR